MSEYTQLFRGPTGVSAYPGWNFEELFKLQNVSAEPDTTEITIPDPTRIGLPPLDSVTSTSAINISGEAVNFSPAAAAVLLYGSVERVPSGTVAEEAHDAYVNHTIRLAHLPLAITAVTSADGVTTYALNKDYAKTPGGIRILLGGDLATAINAVAPVAGELKKLPIKVSYSYPTVDVIKPFTTGQKYYRVMFEQINEGGGNETRRITCYYARISLNGGLPINQAAEFGTVPVQIKLLADPQIIGVGEDAIFRIEHQALAEA